MVAYNEFATILLKNTDKISAGIKARQKFENNEGKIAYENLEDDFADKSELAKVPKNFYRK